MIGRLFGWGSGAKDAAAGDLPVERGPLGIAVGGGIDVDTLGLQADTVGTSPGMPVPEGGMMIVIAYGEARLDATTILSRYYDDRDTILQVMSAGGRPGDEVFDVSLYRPWDSVVPVNAAEWAEWRGPTGLIGQPRYDADGIVFDRFWGEGPGKADLVEFVEDVDDGRAKRSIHQSCMLYTRPLASRQEMLLINIERDLADREARAGASIEFLLGYGLLPGDIRRL